MPTTKSSSEDNSWDITPRPIKEYEARVIVWGTKDIVAMDWEGTSDVYITGFFDSNDTKQTDCHYRC